MSFVWHAVVWELDGLRPYRGDDGKPVTIIAPDRETALRQSLRLSIPRHARIVSDDSLQLDRDAHERARKERHPTPRNK